MVGSKARILYTDMQVLFCFCHYSRVKWQMHFRAVGRLQKRSMTPSPVAIFPVPLYSRAITTTYLVRFCSDIPNLLMSPSGTDSPYRETSNIYDGSAPTADMAVQVTFGCLSSSIQIVFRIVLVMRLVGQHGYRCTMVAASDGARCVIIFSF